MEEWVSIEEDEPQLANGFDNVSIDVFVKTKVGEVKKGFYAFHQNKWFDFNGKWIHDVVAWKSL